MNRNSRTFPASALMLSILAGCGGGGSDKIGEDDVAHIEWTCTESSVTWDAQNRLSGSTGGGCRPRSSADGPAPVEVPPPASTFTPAPSEAPAPVAATPAPASRQPNAVQPKPTPVDSPPPAGTTVQPPVIAAAIQHWTHPPGASPANAMLEAPPHTAALVAQSWSDYAQGAGTTYLHQSVGQAPGMEPRYNLPSLDVQAWSPVGGPLIGPRMIANGVDMTGAGYSPNSPAVLDQGSLAEWTAPGYFAQLQVKSDQEHAFAFRLCWHVQVPEVVRLSCLRFDRLTGQYIGPWVADDSQGAGSLTWR
jgi:hypothetical protein